MDKTFNSASAIARTPCGALFALAFDNLKTLRITDAPAPVPGQLLANDVAQDSPDAAKTGDTYVRAQTAAFNFIRAIPYDNELQKAVAYRAFATVQTILVGRMITGNWAAAGAIAGGELISGTIGRFLHEKAWKYFWPDDGSAKRAAVTAGTWRVIGSLDTAAWSMVFGGGLANAGWFLGYELIGKTFFDFLFNYGWPRVMGTGAPLDQAEKQRPGNSD